MAVVFLTDDSDSGDLIESGDADALHVDDDQIEEIEAAAERRWSSVVAVEAPGSVKILPVEPANASDILDPMDDLNALFATVMNEANVETQAKKAKERLKRGGQTAYEVAADAATVAAWEAMHIWKPMATVAAFVAYHCRCCQATNRVFTGLMQKQLSRQDTTTKRWISVAVPDANLPREIGTRIEQVAMCEQCLLSSWGSAMPAVEEWK